MKRKILLYPLIAGLLMGCSAVGSGERTIILQSPSPSLAIEHFPHLATQTSNQADRVLILGGDGQPTFFSRFEWGRSCEYEKFVEYLSKKYGRKDFQPAQLSINFRDLGTIPLQVPELTMETQKALSKIHLDSNLSKEQRTERAESLRNAFLNQPYMAYSTILKAHDEKGREIYHYFPRIQIDFSADLLSNSNLDRFSQLAMLILIPEADFKEGVRFLDFSPKGANILEFTRGQVQQQSQLIAKASAEAAEPISKSVNLGGELSYTATETFTRDLKDAIEQRTAGVIGNGRGFLVQLRAIKQLRIGGTYSFDVSIEVPSKPVDIPKEKKYEAVPVLKKDPQNKRKLVPNIILVSMVRHVHDRGMTGWFNRVPETENDDVYDQVILKEVNNLPIWEFNDTPWIRPDPIKINTFTAKVITNRKDARFAIFDKNNNILAHGEGENAEISIANDKGQLTNARLIFFPVAYTPTQGNPSNLMPSPTEILISETSGEDISRTFATTYTAP